MFSGLYIENVFFKDPDRKFTCLGLVCIWVNEKVCGDNGNAVVIYLWDKAEVWRLSQKTGVFSRE